MREDLEILQKQNANILLAKEENLRIQSKIVNFLKKRQICRNTEFFQIFKDEKLIEILKELEKKNYLKIENDFLQYVP